MNRLLNFEILRIVSMFMVLILHTPPIFKEFNIQEPNLLWHTLHQLSMVAVNCFVFISGYFFIRINSQRLVKFIIVPFFIL